MMDAYEKAAWLSLLVDTTTEIMSLTGRNETRRTYGMNAKDSRAIIGCARQHAEYLLTLAKTAQHAADKLDAADISPEATSHDDE